MSNGPNVGFVRKEVAEKLPKWTLVDDCDEGQDVVKGKKETYLPVPETNTDAVKNAVQYVKYLLRAVFFPVTRRTLEGLVGQVFSKPIIIDNPSSLDFLETDIDGSGTTLEQQAKSALEALLKKGRAGFLSDFPNVEEDTVVVKSDVESGRIRPRIILYQPEQIINWRETVVGGETQLSLLVLLELKDVSTDEFEIECSPRWRVLRLNEGKVEVSVWKKRSTSAGGDTAGDETDFEIETEWSVLQGGDKKPLERIPFSFVGSTNNDSTVDEPPLYPLACLNIAHYRNSADYEQSLFIAGQPTPVFAGLTDEWVKAHIAGKVTLGSQNAVSLPKGATASLLQATANTMPMEGMSHKEEQMKAIGAKLIEPGTVQQTATEAEIEASSEASILSSIAKNLSAAYELAAHYASIFGDRVELDQINITLNSEFQVTGLNAQERAETVAAMNMEILSRSEVRAVYAKKGIATLSDNDFKAELEADRIEFGTSLDDPKEKIDPDKKDDDTKTE